MTSSIKSLNNVPGVNLYRDQIISGGNLLARPIYWLRKPSELEALKKIFIIFAAIVLVGSVIGLIIFIPALKEWNRQIKVQKSNLSSLLEKGKQQEASRQQDSNKQQDSSR